MPRKHNTQKARHAARASKRNGPSSRVKRTMKACNKTMTGGSMMKYIPWSAEAKSIKQVKQSQQAKYGSQIVNLASKYKEAMQQSGSQSGVGSNSLKNINLQLQDAEKQFFEVGGTKKKITALLKHVYTPTHLKGEGSGDITHMGLTGPEFHVFGSGSIN